MLIKSFGVTVLFLSVDLLVFNVKMFAVKKTIERIVVLSDLLLLGNI